MKDLVKELSSLLSADPAQDELLAKVPEILSDSIQTPEFTRELLERLALDPVFAANSFPSIDFNDLTIYRDPAGGFSIRLLVWDSNTPYPIHDHGSWGVVGALAGCTREIKYSKLTDPDNPDLAVLSVKSDQLITPGQVTSILPLDEGIHRMSAENTDTSLTLHIYGRAIRKGFIQGYHPVTRQVYRIYSPTQSRRVMALHALGALNEGWARETLSTVSQDSSPMIREEALNALKANK
jgi:predicted metal-dependent enzyme (double-stranded beta helix superfamily)